MHDSVPVWLILVLIAILFFALTVAMRASFRHRVATGRGRCGPGKAARALMILAGLGLFVIVAFATLWDRPWTLSMTRESPATVRVGKSMTPPKFRPDEHMKLVETPGRLLIHVIAYRSVENVRFPAHVENFDFNWPEDKEKEVERKFTVDSADFSIHFRPNALWWKWFPGDSAFTTTTLDSQGFLRGTIRSRRIDLAFGGFLGKITGKASGSFAVQSVSPKWFSLTESDPIQYALSVSGEFVSRNTALKSVPVEDYLARFPEGTGPRRESTDFMIANMAWPNRFPRHSPIPGLELLRVKMFASLVLLAAVGLLSRAFRRRALAFAGWTLVAVLLVVGLDRATLARDLSTVSDPFFSAPRVLQARACSHADTTIFYRDTARTWLLRLADYPEVNPQLRVVASGTAFLELSDNPGGGPPRVRVRDPGAAPKLPPSK